MADDVLIEKRSDGVAKITLNRPESLNAMGGSLMPMLAQYLADVSADRGVRCVVLTGAGRAFCAGGDVKGMAAGRDAVLNPNGAAGTATETSPAAVLHMAVQGLRQAQRAALRCLEGTEGGIELLVRVDGQAQRATLLSIEGQVTTEQEACLRNVVETTEVPAYPGSMTVPMRVR